MKSLWNRLAVLSLVLVLVLLASSAPASAQVSITGQTVTAMSIERVLQLNNIHYTVPINANPSVLAALAAGALEVREIITFNPIPKDVTSVVFLVPTGTPFPTPSVVDVLDGPPAGSNVATFTLHPDTTYVTKHSVMFSGVIYTSNVTPFGDYTGAPAVISFGFTNDTPPQINNVVDLISGAVVDWSASGTGTFTLSQPAGPPNPSGIITVALSPANQQVTSPEARITAVASDPNNGSAAFSYSWKVNGPPSATIVNPNVASIDVQLGAGFNVYSFTVTATNKATGATGTATATVQCACSDHF